MNSSGIPICSSLPAAIDQFDEPVHYDAYPEIHEQAQVQAIWLVPSGGRQVRHQNKEVEQIAGGNGHELLKQAAQHAPLYTR